MFEMHFAHRPRSFALASAGNSIAARIAIMAITTSNSIKVNAFLGRDWILPQAGGFVLISKRRPSYTFCSFGSTLGGIKGLCWVCWGRRTKFLRLFALLGVEM